MSEVDERLAVFPGSEQIELVVLHGRRKMAGDFADERGAVRLGEPAVHGAVDELHEKGDELGHDGVTRGPSRS